MSVRSGMADCAVAPGARCLRIAPPESLDVTKLAHALVTLARPRRRMPVTASMAPRSRDHRDGLPARTIRRIPGAATDLFSELGHVATIMEAIAARADVAGRDRLQPLPHQSQPARRDPGASDHQQQRWPHPL